MKLKLPMKIGINKLQLADKVSLEMSEGYDTATVEQINHAECTVKLIRPYIHTADFSCTSGVFTYVGWEYVTLYWTKNEEMSVANSYPRTVILLYRRTLK